MLKDLHFAGDFPQTNLFLATIITPLGYLFLSALVNIYLHPLRKFPGPFWARASNLWGRYQNLYGRKSHRIHAAHKKYGETTSNLSRGKTEH